MPVVFTFHKVSEKRPEHNQEIVWMPPVSSFDFYGFEPKTCTVEYQWTEIDEQGFHTGNAICYSGDGEYPPEGHIIQILFDCYYAEADWLWMGVSDYLEVIPAGEN